MRLEAEDRRMAGIEFVEKQSEVHRQKPEEDPKTNACAKAKMSQTKVGPRPSKSAPNQWKHQQTRIRFASKLFKPKPGVV